MGTNDGETKLTDRLTRVVLPVALWRQLTDSASAIAYDDRGRIAALHLSEGVLLGRYASATISADDLFWLRDRADLLLVTAAESRTERLVLWSLFWLEPVWVNA